MEINWTSIISLVTFITGLATGFLGLYIDNKLNKHKDLIIAHIDAKFASKEATELKLGDINRRLDRLEK